MPMGRIRSRLSGTVARSPRPQYRHGGLHSVRNPLPLRGSGPACEAARACMQPTRLGALAAGACAARTCPRRWRVSGWHDQLRRTAPSAVVHSGTDSDKRAFGGDGTHRQHGLAGRRHSCGNSATSCCELDDDLWGRWRRGERHAMEWVQRRKGVSVVAQRRGEGGGATALPVEERSSSGWRGTLRQWRRRAQTRAVGMRSNSEATAQRRTAAVVWLQTTETALSGSL
jgi:hypothetical protein